MRLHNFRRLRRHPIQPLYHLGNPQWRVFLPRHTIKLLNPEHFEQSSTPHNVVFFEVEMSMTKYELMDYLKNLYKIPVADIQMKVIDPVLGRDHRQKVYISKKEHRLVRVLLEHGYYFEYPKFFEESTEKDPAVESKLRDEMFKDLQEEASQQKDGKAPEKRNFLGMKTKKQAPVTSESWLSS